MAFPIGKRASLIIADNMDAGSSARISLITKYLDKIALANRAAPMFSHIRVYFHVSEVKTPSPLFKAAKERGIGIFADTLNANYRQCKTPQEYEAHIRALMALGVTIGFVDDANVIDLATLAKMIPAIDGFRYVLSTGIVDAREMGDLALNADADVKTTAQTYLNGASVNYLKTWLRDLPMWGVDFECYRDNGRMTTPQEIATMGREVIAARKGQVHVYGHDGNTNLLSKTYASQWAALQTFLASWWKS